MAYEQKLSEMFSAEEFALMKERAKEIASEVAVPDVQRESSLENYKLNIATGAIHDMWATFRRLKQENQLDGFLSEGGGGLSELQRKAFVIAAELEKVPLEFKKPEAPPAD